MKQLVRPSQLKPPILLARLGMEIEELDPRTVWGEVGGWIGSGGHGDDEEDMERKWVIGEQLVNSAGNQSRRFILEGLNSLTNKIFIEEWFRIASTLPRLEFSSPSIAWGKTLITGHPAHPVCPISVLYIRIWGRGLTSVLSAS